MKNKIKKALKNENVKSFFNHLAEWIISAMMGAVISILFGDPFLAFSFLFGFSVFAIIYLLVVSKVQTQWDIIKIMQNEMTAGNYTQVVRMGYSLSRPLHLSGRMNLRFKIGNIMRQACEELLRTRTQTIEINDKIICVKEVKVKILIDDLGWTAYELHQVDVAIDNIKEGISLAEEIKQFTLALKGYRHLIGIYDQLQNSKRSKEAIEKGKLIIENEEYRNSVSQGNYEHTIAEFDYSIAKSMIDERPDEALIIAKRVQRIFCSENSRDNDRYAKTFDLIGDIYAGYNSPERLKKAKAVYLDGIGKCKEYGRSERLIRIAADYIALLNKMLQSNKSVYDRASWETIDEEEADIYKLALSYISNIENRDRETEIRREHKKYLKLRKQYKKGRVPNSV